MDDFLTRLSAMPAPMPEFETAEFVDTRERLLTRLFKFLADHPDEWVRCPDELNPAALICYDTHNITYFTWSHPSKGTLNVYVLTEIDVYGRHWLKFVEASPA